IGRGVEQLRVAFEGPAPRSQPVATQVQKVVHSDTVEPRAKAAPRLEGREPRDDLDQNLLRRVLGVLVVIQHAARDVVDPRLVSLEEKLEVPAAPGSDALDERRVDGIRRRDFGEWLDHKSSWGWTPHGAERDKSPGLSR